jgi:hypothetical protein
MTTASRRTTAPAPPKQAGPFISGSQAIQRWFYHYWHKLQLPAQELNRVAITQDRQEFMRWTGKRLNPMVLGCYCYLPGPRASSQRSSKIRGQSYPSTRTSIETPIQHFSSGHRHLIFIEQDMQPQSIEVTMAHELIHLADRVNGTPRRHHHHGHDSIALDEAAITGYGLEELRQLLHEESSRRERLRRELRPIRYWYECPNCGKEYPRTRRYSQAVSCSSCDKAFNPQFRLRLRT